MDLLLPPAYPEYYDIEKAKTIYEFRVKNLNGEYVYLDKYKGHVCLIVCVASDVKGFTYMNYRALNYFHEKYSESEGLRILAFPCNQFWNTEPGSRRTIKKFIEDNNIKFDVFDKVRVNGYNAHGLWRFLKKSIDIDTVPVIRNPFTKFIINRFGRPVGRLKPEDLVKEMEPVLLKWFAPNPIDLDYTMGLPEVEEKKIPPCMGPWHYTAAKEKDWKSFHEMCEEAAKIPKKK